jgi:small-conductance mechanosensitive channel
MIDILGRVLYGEVTVYDVLVFCGVVVFSGLLAGVLRTYLRRLLKERISADLLKVLEKVVSYTVVVVGVVSVLPLVGVNLTGLLVAGGIVGLVLGFASQSVVANLISGLFLIFERPVRIGEQVEVGDVSGVVVDIRVFSTVVRTYDGVYVRIPNEKVFSSNIVNFVAHAVRRIEYTVGVSYEDDAGKAVQVIREVVGGHPFVLRNPGPNVFVKRLGDSGVDVMVRVWVPSVVWYEVRAELLWKIKVEVENAGITIPFPQRVVHFTHEQERSRE